MNTNKISAEWVNSHKTEFELFGVPSEELSRDELLATIGWLDKQLQWERLRREDDIICLTKKYHESSDY